MPIFMVGLGLSCAVLAPRASAGEFDFGNPAFCEPTEPINDFGLSTLPPTHEAPADGDLSFGPNTVSTGVEAGPIVPVGRGVRFALRSINYYGRTPLEWVMRDRLRAVDAAGNPGSLLSQGKHRIRFINAAREDKLILYPPETPGFYRYETEISDFDGKRLALYASNLRVEREFWDVRLGLNRTVFRPGNHVLSRIENFGTLVPTYGEQLDLQRMTGGEWQPIRIPGRGVWLLWAGAAFPGMSGRCSSLALPRDFPPGHYRIVKEWERGLSRNAAHHYLSAPFEVRARAGAVPDPATFQSGKSQSVGLDLMPAVASPGQKVRVRVASDSAKTVVFGEQFSIQKKVVGGWSRAPFSPKGPWPEDQLQVLGGHSGQWQSVRVPRAASLGKYRAIKPIFIDGSLRRLTASFRVVP